MKDDRKFLECNSLFVFSFYYMLLFFVLSVKNEEACKLIIDFEKTTMYNAGEKYTMSDQAFLQDFDKLYDHFFPLIYRFVARRIQDKETAHDIVSETFLKVYTHLSSFQQKEGATISSWIYTIAKNEVFQYYRSYKTKQTVSLDTIIQKASDENIFQNFQKKELNTLVSTLLEKISRDDKEIILLKYFDELSNIEIADILDIKPNNVGVKLHRALQKFKTILEEHHITL